MKKRYAAAALLLLIATAHAMAQAGMGDVTEVVFHHFGEMKLAFKTRQLKSITGDNNGSADISLKFADGSSARLKADEITFQYGTPEATMPSLLVMKQDVVIDMAGGHYTGDRAEWNQGTGKVILTGDPVKAETEGLELLLAEVRLDLASGDVDLRAGKAGGTGAWKLPAEDPFLLTSGDITDWPGLLNRIRAQAQANQPSPGRHMLSLLDEKGRAQLLETPVDELANDKQGLVNRFNKLLEQKTFSDAPAWEGIDLPAEAGRLMAASRNLSKSERIRLNRLLFDAAYPEYVVPAGKQAG